jgi:hypothetical protein
LLKQQKLGVDRTLKSYKQVWLGPYERLRLLTFDKALGQNERKYYYEDWNNSVGMSAGRAEVFFAGLGKKRWQDGSSGLLS